MTFAGTSNCYPIMYWHSKQHGLNELRRANSLSMRLACLFVRNSNYIYFATLIVPLAWWPLLSRRSFSVFPSHLKIRGVTSPWEVYLRTAICLGWAHAFSARLHLASHGIWELVCWLGVGKILHIFVGNKTCTARGHHIHFALVFLFSFSLFSFWPQLLKVHRMLSQEIHA